MDVPPEFVAQQIDSVFSDLAVGAVKIGMVSNAASIAAIAQGLTRHSQAHIVLDPVMVATSGDRLLRPDAINALRESLMPLAQLITPNMLEAAALLDEPVAASESEMAAQARRLLRYGSRAVLVKGGHGTGVRSTDVLITAHDEMLFPPCAWRHATPMAPGAPFLPPLPRVLRAGNRLADAVAAAKRYVSEALAAGAGMAIGKGHGPVHHFYRWW